MSQFLEAISDKAPQYLTQPTKEVQTLMNPLSQFTTQLFTVVVPIGLAAIVIGTILGLLAKFGEKRFRKFVQGKFGKDHKGRPKR